MESDEKTSVQSKIYRVPDIAKIWGMSPNAIREAIGRGVFPLPPRRMGRVYFWTAGDVAGFLWGDANRRGR